MSLIHVAPFGADYPTLGLFAIEPGQIVELAGIDRDRALATTMFEDVPEPKQPRKRTRAPRTSKTSTPVAAAAENTEGDE